VKELEDLEKIEKGSVELPKSLESTGRLGAPRGFEATSDQFYFWVSDEQLIEKTQLVHAESPAGTGSVTYYALVTEVYRQSRQQDMLEESDRFDGRPEEEVPVDSRGVTYAQARVLATDPRYSQPLARRRLFGPQVNPKRVSRTGSMRWASR